jgi:hypothetical protein
VISTSYGADPWPNGSCASQNSFTNLRLAVEFVSESAKRHSQFFVSSGNGRAPRFASACAAVLLAE